MCRPTLCIQYLPSCNNTSALCVCSCMCMRYKQWAIDINIAQQHYWRSKHPQGVFLKKSGAREKALQSGFWSELRSLDSLFSPFYVVSGRTMPGCRNLQLIQVIVGNFSGINSAQMFVRLMFHAGRPMARSKLKCTKCSGKGQIWAHLASPSLTAVVLTSIQMFFQCRRFEWVLTPESFSLSKSSHPASWDVWF